MSSSETVKRLGREAGFDLVRIASAEPLLVERQRYQGWIEQGRQGDMGWITPQHADRSTSPGDVLTGARSVVSVALHYWSGQRPKTEPNAGKIARYAWGRDYHEVIGERLQAFAQALRSEFDGEHKWYVDTGPVMDKAMAARSGLGWYGKNTNVLTERFGSFVLLGEILTTLQLPPDAPLDRDCGSCRLCTIACPTGALSPDYSIDSRKCISYLTIEHRGPIAEEYRSAIGSWVFGCDVCQDVCPPTMAPHLKSAADRRSWASEVRSQISSKGAKEQASPLETVKPASTPDAGAEDKVHAPRPDSPLFENGKRPEVDLMWMLRLSHDQYLTAFKGTAIKRAKPWMLRRNAAIALGNVGDERAAGPLREALMRDEEPIVRGHSAWALASLAKRLKLPSVADELRHALTIERNAGVKAEIELALTELATGRPDASTGIGSGLR